MKVLQAGREVITHLWLQYTCVIYQLSNKALQFPSIQDVAHLLCTDLSIAHLFTMSIFMSIHPKNI